MKSVFLFLFFIASVLKAEEMKPWFKKFQKELKQSEDILYKSFDELYKAHSKDSGFNTGLIEMFKSLKDAEEQICHYALYTLNPKFDETQTDDVLLSHQMFDSAVAIAERKLKAAAPKGDDEVFMAKGNLVYVYVQYALDCYARNDQKKALGHIKEIKDFPGWDGMVPALVNEKLHTDFVAFMEKS